MEAAEETEPPRQVHRSWRKPSFRGGGKQGKAFGNATHTVMQYLDFGFCADEQSIRSQVEQMISRHQLPEDQAKLVDCRLIANFFETELGNKLRSGIPCIREFKFSILDDGNNYGEGLEGEHVLLQGVVDCALLEEDGITVIDFKTDAATEQNLSQLTALYGQQLKTYVRALERIYRKKVKAAYLYFFRLNRFEEIV